MSKRKTGPAIPEQAMAEAQDVIKIQNRLMTLTPEELNPALEEISQSRFATDAKFLAKTILLCAQFRSNTIDLYVDLAQLLSAEVPEVHDELLAPFFPERVKYFPFLLFVQRAYNVEMFTAKEIVDRITEFVSSYPNEVIPRAYLFYYFAPLIQSENAKLYDDIMKGLQKSVNAFGVFYEIKEFVTNLPQLSKDWKQYWDNASMTYPAGSLAAAIKTDDVELFQEKSQEKEFDVNQEIKLHSYENIVFPEVNPTLVECAAYYGAEKVMRCILRQGPEFKLQEPRTFSFVHFAIAGGYTNMTKTFEQKGCNYRGTLATAAAWHQNELFKWIYGHKEKSVSLDVFLQSAAANNVEAVLFCLDHGIKVNQVNEDNEGALHFAAKHGSVDVVKLLVSMKETDVNLGIGEYRTPLHVAAFAGFDQVVDVLMTRKDLDINAVSGGSGGTALQEAAKAGHLGVVKTLLRRKDINVNGEAPTAIQEAIIHGAAPVAVYLISVKGVDVNARDSEERTCMHLAAASGKPEIVSALLAQKALAGQVMERDMNGQTPIHLAAEQTLSDCMSAFIDSGVKLDVMIPDKDGNTALHLAARNGSARSITRMLSLPNVDVNVKNNHGDTPLHFAAKRCRLQPLKALLSSKDLDLNPQNETGQAPLHWMMSVKPQDGFALLLSQKGLNVNIQDENGESPIHIAAKSIHTEVLAKLLEDPRVDPNVADIHGQNAIHKAAKSSTPESLKIILKRPGLDINKQDENGVTPLHLAARAKESPGVQAILAVPGIDVTLKDSAGQTALHYASAAGTHNIIRCILGAKGVDPNAKDKKGNRPVDLLPKKDKFRNEKLFRK